MSTAPGDTQPPTRDHHRVDRDERKRQRNAQELSKTGGSQKKDRTPSKEEKRKKKNDFSSANGSAHKKPPSGAKRYDKVNIVEKTGATEKENKGKQINEANKSTATRRKLGSKFLDNLSKFESQAKPGDSTKDRNPFVRSYSTQQDKVKGDPAPFRRSYRPSRSTPAVDDPAILVRRSLRKERVLESIAKLEKGGMRKQPASPTNERSDSHSERRTTSRPSSAGSTKTISSDSGSSTNSTKAASRAQQALERHKNRMRKVSQSGAVSPGKPSSPASKSRTLSTAETPTKTPTKSRSRNKDKSLTKTPSMDEPRSRKISVTKTPSHDDADVVEITTVTEIVTPSKEKMDVIIKEKAKSEEELTELIENPTGPEYEPGDPRPLSVGDAVAMFSPEETTSSPDPVTPSSDQKPAKARRKLPEIPTEAEVKERKSRKKRSRKKKPEEGSGEPALITFKPQEVVIVETSAIFQAGDNISPERDQKPSKHYQKSPKQDQKSPEHDQKSAIPDQTAERIDPKIHNFNQNSSKIDESLPSFDPKPKTPDTKAKFAPTFSYDEPVVIIKEKDNNEPISSRHPTMPDAQDPITSPQHTVPGEALREPEENDNPVIRKLKKQYSVEDAIKTLRRLSDEINAEPSTSHPSVKSGIESVEETREEREVEDLPVKVKAKKGHKRRSKKKKEERPTTLEIEEVLYITENVREKPRKESERSSPSKRSPELQRLGDLSSPSEHSRTSSPKKTPKSPSKDLFTFENTPESPLKDTSSPFNLPTSPNKTPRSPVKSPVKTPTSPRKSKSPTKAPVNPVEAPVSIPSPTRGAKSPTKTSKDHSTPISPQKEASFAQRAFDETPSPTKAPPSPTKPFAHQENLRDSKPSTSRSKSPTSPVKTPTSPLKHLLEMIPIEKEAIHSPSSTKSKPEENEMARKRSSVSRRYQKSWLDESSDDDNVSLLSDAPSDASDIDLDWLGPDSDDDYLPRIPKAKLKTGGGVQRSASKASDMLAMWEKKAAKPTSHSQASPSRKISSELKVGNARAAWEVKASQEHRREKSFEKDYKKEIEMERAKVTNGDSSPDKSNSTASTPSHTSRERRSSNDWKPRASEGEAKEMQDIFDERVSGKIQGAKALFENLTHSPVRSPSFARSPRKVSEERSQVFESDESSPAVSRKSSLAENMSQVSEDDEPESLEQSPDIIEDAPKVDNMRALFESQAKQKQETRKHKPSESEKPAPLPQKKAKTPSNIQKRVAARKKTRRSMTQPITSEDVMKAQDMMGEKSKADSDSEEEILDFKERLKFFSQLSTQTFRPKPRERSERRNTQPVKAFQVAKAAETLKKDTIPENNISSLVIKEAPLKGDNDLPPHPEPADNSSRRSSASVRRISRKFSISSSSDNESLLSSSSTSTDDPEPKKKLLLSSGEDSDMSVDIAEIKSTGSIHERLKRLQQNNTEDRWKKKSQNKEIKSSVSDRLNKLKSNNDKWKTQGNTEFVKRAEKLSERIARIKEDAMTWKEKAGKQNDAAQFTIQAKLAKREGKNVVVLPSASIKRKVLPMIVPTKAVTEKEAKVDDDSASMNQLSFVEKLANKGLEENVIKTTEVHTIEVPTIDNEEFDKFFVQNPEIIMNGDVKEHLIIDELPEVKESKMLSDLGRMKTSVRRTKRKPTSKNPVKALAARDDLKQSYETSRSNISKLEQQRIAVQRGHAANFTSAALAGLAAKADLKSVSLRSTKNTPMPSNDDLRPFKDVMLLRAKGRRQVQTRLVEPCAKSLCSDDAFLLITANQLYGWFGEFCNVIERAKINEIADYIVIKGDLGCKVPSLTTIEEIVDSKRHKEFWDLLGGYEEWDKTTAQGGDEQYEIDIEATMKTYKMIDSKLVPYEDAWGKFPKMGMLGSSDTFVFDFGAEMYIWQGKEVSFADRRLAVRLARVIWDEGFDYTEHGFCPFHANELKGPRPEFGLFARVNENLETSLFQEKFEDWSNIYRETGDDQAQLRESSRGKVISENKTKSSIVTEMETCDVVKMVEEQVTPAPLMIEGYDISHGDGDIVDEDGRILEIITTEVETHHVSESTVERFTDSVLHRSNSYVVKWKYSISSTGRFTNSKEINNNKSDSSNGRHRVAYFSWAGVDSPINDKGASALIASNMDTDDGPIINVDESTAPPVFSRCFQGNLMVTNGKRGERKGAYNWRLYKVTGSSKDSASLVEVSCECKSLRSASSFVTFIPRDATAIVWHGCKSPENVREAAEEAVNKLSDRMPKSLPFRRNPTCLQISICEEGKEIDLFWEAVGIMRRERYECLLESDAEERTTRAWKFTTEAETFVAKELPPVQSDTTFPLVQEQLLEIETPSIILLDCMHGVFLWQNCDAEALTGSGKRRWDVIRRLAMETAIKYCEEHNRGEAKLIEAKSEPKQFTNAFPSWKVAEKGLFDRSLATKPKLVRDILSTLTRLTYSIEELRSADLPDGVDARHLETYLTNSDFEKLFEMPRKEFYELPPWKQTKVRKAKKFF